jgi:hypothetical protein
MIVMRYTPKATLGVILSKIRPFLIETLQARWKVGREGLRNWLRHQELLLPDTKKLKS